MESRESIVERIKSHLPHGADEDIDLREDSVLSELGVSSMHLITMLLALQQEYSLSIDQLSKAGISVTVSDLVTFIQQEAPGK